VVGFLDTSGRNALEGQYRLMLNLSPLMTESGTVWKYQRI